MPSKLLCKAQSPDGTGRIQRVTPETAGWKYVGFEAYLLKPGQTIRQDTAGNEVCLVMVAGIASVKTPGGEFKSVGKRMSPFERTPPHSVYVPAGSSFTLTADTDAEVAVCRAPGTGKFPARLIGPGDVGAAHRGRGRNQRDVHNILDDNAQAESLLVVEVFTNEGNTSSYPSHKHDTDAPPAETYLEETYYHRFDPPAGWALQRIYVDDRSLDESCAVYDRDVVMAPRGYHPVATIAGYDNYYLNVMAGPVKQWKFTWEPDHEWINSDAYPRAK